MRALICLAVFLNAAPAMAEPYGQGNFQHGDWEAYCAPRIGCEAVSRDESSDTSYFALSIVRLWGPEDQPAVQLSFGEPAASLIEEGGYIISFALPGQDVEAKYGAEDFHTTSQNRFELSRAASERLLPAMLAGERLVIAMDFPQKEVTAEISLSGISATLRWVDDFQGRAGTTSALVAKGNGVMATTPPPAIYASAPSDLPPAVQDAWVNTGSNCEELDPIHFELSAEGHAMADGKTLWLLPCGYPGAYNMPMVAIVEEEGDVRNKAPEWFATPGQEGAVTTTLTLYNLDFDEESGELASFFKGRGIGDCGLYQVHRWNGEGFGLIEARVKDDCDGAAIPLENWPLVFGVNQD